MYNKYSRYLIIFAVITGIFTLYQFGFASGASEDFSAADLIKTKYCYEAEISPDGKWVAYTSRFMRPAGDKAGSYYRELFLVSTRSREVRPFITGKVSVTGVNWSPDGSRIGFLMSRGKKAKTQVWSISLNGGEAKQLTRSVTSVSAFQWHPTQNKIAYTAKTPKTAKEKKLAEKGYGFIFYEENLKHKNLYMLDLSSPNAEAKQLTKGKTVRGFEFSRDGKAIVLTANDKNLVDHSYMFKKIYLLNPDTLELKLLLDKARKLGSVHFSPDRKKLAYAAGLDIKDHAISQLYVFDIASKKETNISGPDFPGHVSWAAWKDTKTVAFYAGEGVWSTLNLMPAAGGKRRVIYNSKDTGVAFKSATFSKDFKYAAFSGSTPYIPSDPYVLTLGKKKNKKSLVRLTDLNPWLAQRKLGKQEVIKYKARDGWEIEGLLIYPVGYKKGQTYPLAVQVHGGPESHYLNRWNSRYAAPGQVMAAKGYAVYFPNYRASTGYGVKYAMAGYHDAAGKEFDDIADGIKYLIGQGIADKDRVGLNGGSYGGYAAAWFGSYYTEYVRAVCMFVGISDLVSKRGTTDIPYEELYVHSGKKLEDMWEESLKRSPVYWAHKSKSAVLIIGGTNDTRVHPSQSLEFYRRLKMNNHPAVRMVQYPGEGHGNRKQTGRIDVLYRIIGWYDWYVKNKKPLNGPLPPLDISDKYGLKDI